MQSKTLSFATTTPNSHIAIVDCDRYETAAHFRVVQQQLSAFAHRVSHAERRIHLINGTVFHFIPAPSFERLRGLQLDRIETTPSTLPLLPEYFLETRLKSGIMPDDGIIYRAKGEYGGSEPVLGFANG
jgi:hypothetical protein